MNNKNINYFDIPMQKGTADKNFIVQNISKEEEKGRIEMAKRAEKARMYPEDPDDYRDNLEDR